MMASATSYLVVTAVGPDRPGLVNAISSRAHDGGVSLMDSRMAILGGEFALLLLMAAPEPALAAFEAELPKLEADLGLKLIAKRTKLEEKRHYLPYALRATGVDRPGIVRAVTDRLVRRGINVASLQSRVSFAPLSGTPLFDLDADLEVPSEVALAELRREMASLADEENLDVTLEAKR